MKLTSKYLHSILSYDKITGIFRWIAPRKRIVVGAIAGAFDKDGYRIIKIDQKNYRAGRLAVFFVTGRWPKGEVDHENLQKADDRWSNLRVGTKSQNMWNLKVRSDSATGVKCVQEQKGGTYVVHVAANKVRTKVGVFRSMAVAKREHAAAVARLHPGFGRAQ